MGLEAHDRGFQCGPALRSDHGLGLGCGVRPLFCGEVATGSVVVVIAVGRTLITRMVELN